MAKLNNRQNKLYKKIVERNKSSDWLVKTFGKLRFKNKRSKSINKRRNNNEN
jgi:hypothetical protein